MRRCLTVVAVSLVLASLSQALVIAGPYADDLSKCLVKATTDDDKNYLVKWMFAAAALHPQVAAIANITDEQRAELSLNAGKMFERLLTESCKSETQSAVKYEGPGTLTTSFQVLGQVAAQGLFSHPAVSAFMSDFTKYMDKEKLQKLVSPPQ
jgi:hypothetical protein